LSESTSHALWFGKTEELHNVDVRDALSSLCLFARLLEYFQIFVEAVLYGFILPEPLLKYTFCFLYLHFIVPLLSLQSSQEAQVTVIMSASPSRESPTLQAFPRRFSAASNKPPLSRIAESPKKQVTMLNSPNFINNEPVSPYDYFNFPDSSSSTASESSTSSSEISPLLPDERFPSCLSLNDLGYESDNDWMYGWDIQEARAVDLFNEHARLLEVGELPVIREGEFNYIPAIVRARSFWSDDASDRSLRLAKSRLSKQKHRVRHGLRLRTWLRAVLKKIGWSGKN
jgi:hypothetical protein